MFNDSYFLASVAISKHKKEVQIIGQSHGYFTGSVFFLF